MTPFRRTRRWPYASVLVWILWHTALGALCAQSPAGSGQGSAAPPEDVNKLVTGLQVRYQSVRSVRADFTQTYRAPGMQQVESGTLQMQKPGLMRWEYRQPEFKLFVADGRNLYLYTPADRQVLISDFQAEDARATPLQFLLGKGDIRASFQVSSEAEFPSRLQNTGLVRLTPRSPQTDYAYVVLEIDLTSFELRRLAIRERTGNISEFLLTNLETNLPLKRNAFEFRIPKGVEVIRLDDR